MSNKKIAAAVSGIVAAAPSICAGYVGEVSAQTAAANASATFWLAGSSAGVAAFGSSVGPDLCNTTLAPISTFVTIPGRVPAAQNPSTPTPAVGTPDFRMFSCVASAALAALNGQTINIAYRVEGGSIVGVYAPLNNAAVSELDIALAWCSPDATTADQYDCATQLNATVSPPAGAALITGSSARNGPTDTYGGPLLKHTIAYGISDLEPGAFGSNAHPWAGGGNQDPLNSALPAPYPYTFLGANASPSVLQAMPHTLIFQQTFGWVANAGLGISDISSADLAAILSQQTTDWGKIPKTAADEAGAGRVSPLGSKIVVCHRDLGSGERASADIVFTGDGCNPYGASIKTVDSAPLADNFSTPDELACVDSTPNSIGYVSIDAFRLAWAYPNVKALTLDGRSASNGATATGSYNYAVEASINKNLYYEQSANDTSFFPRLIVDLQNVLTAPQSLQINVLPAHGNNSSNNGTIQRYGVINVTSFARDIFNGNSCSALMIR